MNKVKEFFNMISWDGVFFSTTLVLSGILIGLAIAGHIR